MSSAHHSIEASIWIFKPGDPSVEPLDNPSVQLSPFSISQFNPLASSLTSMLSPRFSCTGSFFSSRFRQPHLVCYFSQDNWIKKAQIHSNNQWLILNLTSRQATGSRAGRHKAEPFPTAPAPLLKILLSSFIYYYHYQHFDYLKQLQFFFWRFS